MASSRGGGGGDRSGYFSSPQTLSRTAQKLTDRGLLDSSHASSVAHCIAAHHSGVDANVVRALQPHLPPNVHGESEEHHAVRELAQIVASSLANYARAASEHEQQQAARTIASALRRRRDIAHAERAEAAARNPLEIRGGGGAGSGSGSGSGSGNSSQGGSGGDGDGGGGLRRAVIFSRLGPAEKEKFMDFLIKHRVAFSRHGDEFVATLRMVPKRPGLGSGSNGNGLHDDSSLTDGGNAAATAPHLDEALFGKRAPRPPQDQARIVRAMARSGGPNFDFHFADYPQFALLINAPRPGDSNNNGNDDEQPQTGGGDQQQQQQQHAGRLRPLAWLLRLIEDVYESRFAFDRARLRATDDDGGSDDGGAAGASGGVVVSVVSCQSRAANGCRSFRCLAA
jgi:hypothetical protein